MRTTLPLLIGLLISFSAIGQNGNLSGYVLFDNNTPALGASIVLSNETMKKDISTGISGEFIFKNLDYGDYTLEIHSLNAKSKTVHTKVDANTNTINVVLELTDHQDLQEVLVQTKTEKRKIEDEGFAVNVIETKEASIRNIQTNELLNTTVGVKIRQNGGLGSNVQYSLNGLSGSAVRIFIDGIPISTYGSSFSLNSIPPSMIKRIEVYKGVVPGHLADDALGGAINIVLHNSTKTNFNASVSYGSFNTLQTSVNGLYRFDKSGFTVKASGFHNYSDNDYKVWGGQVKVTGLGGVQTPITARRFNDAYRSTGGMAQVGFTNVTWADQFFIGMTASDNYKEIQHGAFMTIMPYKNRYMESDAMLSNLTYKKENLFTEGLDVSINGLYGKRNRVVSDTLAWAYAWNGERAIDYEGNEYQYSWGSQQEKEEYGPILNHINRNVASIRTGASYAINKHHKVLLNHVYSSIDRKDRDDYASDLENTFTGTRELRKNIFSATYELNAFENKLKASVFGKYYQQKTINIDPYVDQNTGEIQDDITRANTTNEGYGFAFSYAIHPNITILTSAEKAIRLPNETEVFGNDGDNVVANPSINPEQSKNYNFGFRLGTFSLKKHDFTFATNLFTRNIKDRIGLPIERTPDEVLILYENQGHGTSKGIDAQFNYTYNKNFAFNFNLSRFDLKVVNRGVEIDVPNTPFFTMNSNFRYSLNNVFQKHSALNLFYTLYFTDEFSYIPPQGNNTTGNEFFNVPQQLAQDFGLSYAFPNQKFVVSFDVKNIFNEALYDNLRVQKPGRAFYLKLNYFINKS
ncbi:TonB-dependent receptor [Aestuariibaculum sp. YM273]|uniref:TonB-dependent receptor n=1 Tax=Aestuariibaculum sp. YM273 TaxID=3070659 RepID=UPI0027DB3A80|nr:TonB-dependent receptor plug domain-containing protein [Aestuariibaculum sp. YM273]WMI66794.1 TonB-dependent receptor [Aestuariibaculum sp. YM273]